MVNSAGSPVAAGLAGCKAHTSTTQLEGKCRHGRRTRRGETGLVAHPGHASRQQRWIFQQAGRLAAHRCCGYGCACGRGGVWGEGGDYLWGGKGKGWVQVMAHPAHESGQQCQKVRHGVAAGSSGSTAHTSTSRPGGRRRRGPAAQPGPAPAAAGPRTLR